MKWLLKVVIWNVPDLRLHASGGTGDALGPVRHVGVRGGAGPLVRGAGGRGEEGVVWDLELVVGRVALHGG